MHAHTHTHPHPHTHTRARAQTGRTTSGRLRCGSGSGSAGVVVVVVVGEVMVGALAFVAGAAPWGTHSVHSPMARLRVSSGRCRNSSRPCRSRARSASVKLSPGTGNDGEERWREGTQQRFLKSYGFLSDHSRYRKAMKRNMQKKWKKRMKYWRQKWAVGSYQGAHGLSVSKRLLETEKERQRWGIGNLKTRSVYPSSNDCSSIHLSIHNTINTLTDFRECSKL